MLKFIENPPTVEDLKSLYESDTYQNLLSEFAKLSKHKLDNRESDDSRLFNILSIIQRRYVILNIPFDEVLSEFEKQKEVLLKFTILSTNFFIEHDEDPDGEFPEGEGPDAEEKSEVIETLGIAKTFLLDKFCETYLLNLGDKERLLHFLKTTRMPQAKKYIGQISKLYNHSL